MSFIFISTRIKNKIELRYHLYQYWICTKIQKVSITADATLWAGGGGGASKLDMKIFARQFYELVAENLRGSRRNKSKRHASDVMWWHVS